MVPQPEREFTRGGGIKWIVAQPLRSADGQQRRQASGRSVAVADGDRAAERDHRRRRYAHQAIIKRADTTPVCLFGAWRSEVGDGDRGLDVVGAELVTAGRAVE